MNTLEILEEYRANEELKNAKWHKELLDNIRNSNGVEPITGDVTRDELKEIESEFLVKINADAPSSLDPYWAKVYDEDYNLRAYLNIRKGK